MIKKKIIYSLLAVLMLFTYFSFNTVYAKDNPIPCYDFYIKQDSACLENSYSVLVANSILENTLVNGKIAPGTKGEFLVNVHISSGVISKYKLIFDNFSNDLPKNLKFYFNGEEIDLKTFSLTDIQSSDIISYVFNWEWMYETEDEKSSTLWGDIEDTYASELDTLNFDIVLHAEYEEIIIENNEKLPRTR